MASKRLSTNKSSLARQYNNQTTDRATAYDTPFADIPLPIHRNGIGSKMPVLRPTTLERHRRLYEIGSKSIESCDGDSLELHPRDVEVSKRKPSVPTLNHPMDQGAPETTQKADSLGDHISNHENAPVFFENGKAEIHETQPTPSDKEDSDSSLANMQGSDRDLSMNQDVVPDAETFREVSRQHATELSEAEGHADPALDETVSRTIHILGSNAVGKFFAHALAGLPQAPPVTLLVHNTWLIKEWLDGGSAIRLLRDNRIYERTGFDVELMDSIYGASPGQRSRNFGYERLHGPQETIIDNLVVTTEGYTTVSALAAVQHRLQPSSTVCFMQDSLGIIDYVNSSIFPDPTRRPNYILGNVSHEVYAMKDRYSIVQHGSGRLALTAIPREIQKPQIKEGEFTVRRMDLCWQSSSKYLMHTFRRTTELCTAALPAQTFYKQQLTNLAITAVLGPVTVVHECFNDQLLHSREASRTIYQLLEEISLILRSLPEVAKIPSADQIFSTERLRKMVFSAIAKSGRNRSPMLQDVMDGKDPKIDFSNGYLLRRAEELGIDCPRLAMITSMVKAKQGMRRWENNSHIPFKYRQ